MAGSKASGLWFIFPQLEGLSHSPFPGSMAHAYLAHPVLGGRS